MHRPLPNLSLRVCHHLHIASLVTKQGAHSSRAKGQARPGKSWEGNSARGRGRRAEGELKPAPHCMWLVTRRQDGHRLGSPPDSASPQGCRGGPLPSPQQAHQQERARLTDPD